MIFQHLVLKPFEVFSSGDLAIRTSPTAPPCPDHCLTSVPTPVCDLSFMQDFQNPGTENLFSCFLLQSFQNPGSTVFHHYQVLCVAPAFQRHSFFSFNPLVTQHIHFLRTHSTPSLPGIVRHSHGTPQSVLFHHLLLASSQWSLLKK